MKLETNLNDKKDYNMTKADITLADEVFESVRISKITGKPVQRRGFATMDPTRRSELAKIGGASVNPANRSFSQNRDLAISAGRKGGENRHKNKEQE